MRSLVVFLALLCGCRTERAAIKLDGELDEEAWTRAARSGAFVDTAGEEARPYSDARFLWDDEALYVALYAGDDDIHARVTEHDGPVWLDDAFSLHLTPAAPGSPTYVIELSAGGVVTDGRRDANGKLDLAWESGATLAVDRDGTPNDPRDEDEEWVIEAAIPLRSLGLRRGEQVMIEASRCDTPRGGGKRRCGSFKRTIELIR